MKKNMLTSVLLVAGSSRRFGSGNKLLQNWKGLPLCVHALNSLIESQSDNILIVTGYQHELVQTALITHCEPAFTTRRVRVVHNHAFNDGMGSSIAFGMHQVDQSTGAVLVCLGDMPNVSPEIINALIATWQENPDFLAYVPTFADERGNPVLLSSELFDELGKLTGDRGAKDLLTKNQRRVLPVPFTTEAIRFDIDAQSDL